MTAFTMERPPNPKLRAVTHFGRAHWYPYYAGYSPLFVQSVLKSISASRRSLILDPWNGSGTTTAVCSFLGYPSLGFDLNPAMVVVGRARLLQQDVKASLRPILKVILKKASEHTSKNPDDPLLDFFGPETASLIRGLERSVAHTLGPGDGRRFPSDHGALDHLSSLAAFYYVALFRALRAVTTRYRTTNPTWLRVHNIEGARVGMTENTLASALTCEVDTLIGEGLAESIPSRAPAQVTLADSRTLPLADSSVNGIITSPPYCTRIDYAVATRLELAVLGAKAKTTFAELRRSLIGSTAVRALSVDSVQTPHVRRTLDSIRTHSSKASSTYYHKTFLDYFSGLERSVAELARVLKPRGLAALVVQDSYYKDIHVDLPALVRSIGERTGLKQLKRWNYVSKQTMRQRNPLADDLAKKHLPIEAVVILERG